MDDDLAFCVGRFIDEQIKIIDDEIKKIENEESIEMRKIEEKRALRGPMKDRGKHAVDGKLVDKFVAELREAEQNSGKKMLVDDPVQIAALRAEISTKIGAARSYLLRLKSLAGPLPRSKAFTASCDEAIRYFRDSSVFEQNFENFMKDLQDVSEDSIATKTQTWWKSTYGKFLKNLSAENGKLNPGLEQNGFTIVSPTSRIVSHGKVLLEKRQFVAGPDLKIVVIRNFARDLCRIDDDQRKQMGEEKLVEKLNNEPVDQVINFAQGWLRRRDKIRNQRDPLDVEKENFVAEFGRRKIAQGAKKLATLAVFRRLAVGSGREQQFDERLRKGRDDQAKNFPELIPIISRDLGSLDEGFLQFDINILIVKTKVDGSLGDESILKEKYKNAFAQSMEIPRESVQIQEVKPDNKLIHGQVEKPHGKRVVEVLNGTAPDAVLRAAKLREQFELLGVKISSIDLGDSGLDIKDRMLDPRWNITYASSSQIKNGENYWEGPIPRGGKPYYCPSGWKRYGINVASSGEEFEAKWGNWCVAYHGTQGRFASSILMSGLKVSTQGCFYEVGTPRVYVSPSIEYSAHPRYAYPWQQVFKDGRNVWYQLIFQCRVNPKSINRVAQETLLHQERKANVIVDKNFKNNELEWIILGKNNNQFINDDIICYGMLIRTSHVDPEKLPTSKWWPYSLHHDIYKKKA